MDLKKGIEGVLASPGITRATFTTFGGTRVHISKAPLHPPPREGQKRTQKDGKERFRTGYKSKFDEEPRFKSRMRGTIAWRWVKWETYQALHSDPATEAKRKKNGYE